MKVMMAHEAENKIKKKIIDTFMSHHANVNSKVTAMGKIGKKKNPRNAITLACARVFALSSREIFFNEISYHELRILNK